MAMSNNRKQPRRVENRRIGKASAPSTSEWPSALCPGLPGFDMTSTA